MLFGLLSVLFALGAILMIFLILVQKGKGGMGMGNLGGSNQMLFGSGGGQDIFQKTTWILGAILVCGSLGLAIWKTKLIGVSASVLGGQRPVPTRPGAPVPPPAPIPLDDEG